MESQPPENPFIERPDEHVISQELFCWMPSNADRECGPDCVAFDPRFATEPKVTSCSVLNLFKSVALSAAQISIPLVQMSKRQNTADRAAAIKNVTSDPPSVK